MSRMRYLINPVLNLTNQILILLLLLTIHTQEISNQYIIKSLMHQLDKPIKKVTELCKIYPDIQGQLCSRHSTLFGKLRGTFNKLYDSFQPEHYVVVKGSALLFGQCGAKLSMALENGLIILVRRTFQNKGIYINGNHIDDEVIFSYDGAQKQGMHPQIDEIALCLKTANQNLQKQQLFGGIIYVHSNIPEETFKYGNALLIGLFISFLLINKNVDNHTLDSVFNKLGKISSQLNRQSLTQYFRFYSPRTFHLQVAQTDIGIDLQFKYKPIICKLDVAQIDLDFQRKNKSDYLVQKNDILDKIKKNYGLSSIFEVFNAAQQRSITIQNDGRYKIPHSEFLKMCLKQMNTLCEFSNKNLSFSELVKTKWELDSKYWRVYSNEVVQLVEKLRQQLNIQSCMVFEQQFLLIVSQKSKYTELLVKLRQKMRQGQMKSKSLFNIEEQLVQNRWGSDKQIGQIMFTSVPSEGVAIFDPSEAIWFDDDD